MLQILIIVAISTNTMQNNKVIDVIKEKQNALEVVNDDPRVKDDGRKIVKMKGAGRNTESFDPKSTLVRPEMRIMIGPNKEFLDRKIKHDDVVIVPEFFCKEDDWSIYYSLVEEMRASQATGLQKSEWISWHEGAHLISKNPTGSPTFNAIQAKISKYFGINNAKVGTRYSFFATLRLKPHFHLTDRATLCIDSIGTKMVKIGSRFIMILLLSILIEVRGEECTTNRMFTSF